MFMPTDETASGMRQLGGDLGRKGAALLVADPAATAPSALPALPADQPEADALCLIQSFYTMTVDLADRLGVDVDRPRNLHKVTRTT
jgi:glucosamine--fructose-6-phosphate aminotransferase (isomerizing)